MAPARFTFERAFPDTPDRFVPLEEKEPTIRVAEHQSLLELAVANARTQGFLEGQDQARQEETARLARALESVSDALDRVRDALEGIQAQSSAEALDFALMFAQRLAGAAVFASPMAPIEDSARRIFEDLRGSPHVAVRVAPDLVEATRDRMQGIARDKGFEGRLIVLGEPEIMPGDVRIEWADGGLVRDRAATEQVLTEAIAQALARTGV